MHTTSPVFVSRLQVICEHRTCRYCREIKYTFFTSHISKMEKKKKGSIKQMTIKPEQKLRDDDFTNDEPNSVPLIQLQGS